jgi:hypothetical protein
MEWQASGGRWTVLASLRDASFLWASPGCRYAQPRANGCDASGIGLRDNASELRGRSTLVLPAPGGATAVECVRLDAALPSRVTGV